MSNGKRLQSRDALIEAAFELFGQNPSAPLARVAERAGVGRATLHRYFPDRSDLMRTLVSQAADELDAAATEAARGARSHTQALEKIMEAVIALGDRQWFLARESAAAELGEGPKSARHRKEFRQLMACAREEGLMPRSCPLEWSMAAYDHLVYAAWMSVRDGEVTAKQASRLAWQTLTSGIGQAEL